MALDSGSTSASSPAVGTQKEHLSCHVNLSIGRIDCGTTSVRWHTWYMTAYEQGMMAAPLHGLDSLKDMRRRQQCEDAKEARWREGRKKTCSNKWVRAPDVILQMFVFSRGKNSYFNWCGIFLQINTLLVCQSIPLFFFIHWSLDTNLHVV